MIIFNYFYNKRKFGNLIFLDLNIIFNLLHPTNHSKTLRNITLNPPTFTFNPLKVNNTNFWLYFTWCQHVPLPPINREGERGEGRGKFFFFLIISVLQWFEGDI